MIKLEEWERRLKKRELKDGGEERERTFLKKSKGEEELCFKGQTLNKNGGVLT